jgi:hypothetical protein
LSSESFGFGCFGFGFGNFFFASFGFGFGRKIGFAAALIFNNKCQFIKFYLKS